MSHDVIRTDLAIGQAPRPGIPMLEVKDLGVRYRTRGGQAISALRGLSFELRQGELLGIVGETGSGKSTLAHTLLGLLTRAEIDGEVSYRGQPLPLHDEEAMREIRWREIALVFQVAGTGFDPVYPVGDQIREPLLAHRRCGRDEARARVAQLWEDVGLEAGRLNSYPHQLSGGEKRLAMLAMALVCDPELLMLDEPTAGLDSFTRIRVLSLLKSLQRRRKLTMIVITHTLSDLDRLAERTMILYAGKAVEIGPTREVLTAPLHPYSWGLLNAYPSMRRARDLWGIRGDSPDPICHPTGCAFAPRCTQAEESCFVAAPDLAPHDGRLVACHFGGLRTLLEARGLSNTFRDHGKPPVCAVREASLRLLEGEVVALVGQTGSGKSTLARLLVGLADADCGEVFLEGQPLSELSGPRLRRAQRRLQLIFQDPFDALSPRMSVLELVREPLDIQGGGSTEERNAQARAAIAEVRLPTTDDFLAKRSHELSGGQLQRVAIARALVLRPKVLVADEPVSMLDASEQARLLRLLKDLQNERGMGLLLISHDIALVRKVADRILVMEKGVIVEEGPADRVINAPRHPYTVQLLAAAYATAEEGGEVDIREQPGATMEPDGDGRLRGKGAVDGLEPTFREA